MYFTYRIKLDNNRIGEDHYIQSGNKSYDFPEENSNKLDFNLNDNKSPFEKKYSNVQKSSDPRFASISSVPMESLDDQNNQQNNFSENLSTVMGSAYSISKSLASNLSSTVSDKVTEYELGDKLYQAGGKTADILYSASYKVYEKSSEIVVIIKKFSFLF